MCIFCDGSTRSNLLVFVFLVLSNYLSIPVLPATYICLMVIVLLRSCLLQSTVDGQSGPAGLYAPLWEGVLVGQYIKETEPVIHLNRLVGLTARILPLKGFRLVGSVLFINHLCNPFG